MLEEWAEQAVMRSALRFDGGKWVESVRPAGGADLGWLTGPLVDNLTLYHEPEKNLAVFFGLQRYLYKWGGEQSPEQSRERLAFYLLYLRLQDVKVPKKFAAPAGTFSFTTDPAKTDLDVIHAVQSHIQHVWPMLAYVSVDPTYRWGKPTLNNLQVGRYGEYFAKMELTRLGGEVYTSEVDDRGVDFVLRTKSGRLIAIQVKTVRSYQAVSLLKKNFSTAANSWLVLVELIEGRPPQGYIVPAAAWEREDDKYFASGPDGSEWKLHYDGVSKRTLAAKYAMTRLPNMDT